MLRFDANISSPVKALFIDLDWSGAAGTEKYLCNPNRSLGPGRPRPLAVVKGAIMQQEHDIDTMQVSFGGI